MEERYRSECHSSDSQPSSMSAFPQNPNLMKFTGGGGSAGGAMGTPTKQQQQAPKLTEVQIKVANLAKTSATSFFEIVLQKQLDSPEINFSEILEQADKFNKVFQDTITQQWNDIQVAKSTSVDYSQHCDTDEDEVFENSLYQPCPDGPVDNEPVYENSDESEYQNQIYQKFRGSDSSQSLGDVTPTPPTEGHYSTMHESDGNVYDTPPISEEMLRTHFAAQGMKVENTPNNAPLPPVSQYPQSVPALPQKTSPSHNLQKSPPTAAQQQEELDRRTKNMQLNLQNKKPPSPVNNSNPIATEQQNGGNKVPKMKGAIMDVSSESADFRKKDSTTKSGVPQSEPKPVQPALSIKKESVLELRTKVGETSQSSWQTCRLVLAKTHGGMMLNVYTPPDSDRIFNSIFCSMIYEIGEATESQYGKTADRVLVIKAQDNVAVTLRARNYEDKHDWICVIRENTDAKTTKRVIYESADQLSPMTPTQDMYDRQNSAYASDSDVGRRSSTSSQSSLYSRDSMERGQSQYVTAQVGYNMKNGDSCGGLDRQVSMPAAPTYIYQDGAVYARQNSVPHGANGKSGSMANIAEREAEKQQNMQRIASCGDFTGPQKAAAGYARTNPIEQLKAYPWFHGKLPREKASKMVLAQPNPEAGHGIYLVRQSENNDNEFTLTFNYEGKAKHLRMYVDMTTGVCQVQHLPYKSLYHMIEHHRRNPLPIDIKGSSPITLKSYITNFGGASGSDQQPQLQQQLSSRDHRRNKSVDFNIDRNQEIGPSNVSRHTSLVSQYGQSNGGQGGGPPRQTQRQQSSNNSGVYYSSHS